MTMKMRRAVILSIVLAGCVQAALAQNTIASIRKAYQEQKENIARMSDNFPSEGIPPEYYHLRVSQNLPGTGGHFENVRFYYGEERQEEKDGEEYNPYPPHYLTFVSSKYNFAAREFYEEYLYDENGQVMFIYARTPDLDFPKMHELRLYFDGKRLLRLNVKEAEDLESFEDAALKKAQFKDIYTGTTIPEAYEQFCNMYKNQAKRFLSVFKSIDDNTYK